MLRNLHALIQLVTLLFVTILFFTVGCNKDKPIVPDEQKLNGFIEATEYLTNIKLPLVQLDSIRVISIALPPAFNGELPDICFCIEGSAEILSDGSWYFKNTADQVLNNVFPSSLPQTVVLDSSYKFNVGMDSSITTNPNGYFLDESGLAIHSTELDFGSDTCESPMLTNVNTISYSGFSSESFRYYYNNGFNSIYIKESFITYILFFHFEK